MKNDLKMNNKMSIRIQRKTIFKKKKSRKIQIFMKNKIIS